MKSYQILLKNNEKTGSLNYRKILKLKKINVLPKQGTDGLSIFITANEEQLKILKYDWILAILSRSEPIDIVK